MPAELVIPEGKAPKKVVAEIGKLRNERGLITPQSVVDYARAEKSPLHNYFTWDDSIAGERYRLIEAQRLIRTCVTYLPNNNVPIRAYVSLRENRIPNGGYIAMAEVLNDDDLTSKLIQDALYELHVFQEKYRRLQELAPVFKACDEVNQALGKKDKAGETGLD